MNVGEVLQALEKYSNEELAKMLNVRKAYISKRFKELGYKYDRKQFKYVFTGNTGQEPYMEEFVGTDAEKLPNKSLKKITINTDKSLITIKNKEDKNQIKVGQSSGESEINMGKLFTEEEIDFIKEAVKYKGGIGTRSELFQQLEKLPRVKKSERAKPSIFISKQTEQELNDFVEKKVGQVPTKMQIIEIALREFMEKYKNI